MAKGKRVVVKFPSTCPELDPNCETTRSVSLYVDNRNQIWLCIDDVDWAIRYLYGQHKLKGVDAVSPESAGPSGGEDLFYSVVAEAAGDA